MLAPLSQWLLIVAIGQAPAEATLLKAAPADVDVAVRVRGLEAGYNDAVAYLKAMNPDWGQMAEGALTGQIAEARQKHGERVVKSPFLGLVRLGDGGDGGPPPFAILVQSDDYKGTLKDIAGGKDVELKPQDGVDAFDSPDGNGSWYAAKAPGVVAFGPSKGLIAEIARRPGKALDSVIAGASAASFSRGDIGVYINADALAKRYAEQIEQARQAFMAALDQAGQAAGNEGVMKMAKDMYGKMFDTIQHAESLTLSLDLSAKGGHLAGYLAFEPDDEAKAAPETHRASPAGLAKLPADGWIFTYMDVDAQTFEKLQAMGMNMLHQGAKASPALEKARAKLHGIGRIESVGAVMNIGMTSITELFVPDPAAYIDACVATTHAMQEGGDGQPGLYRDVKVERDAQTAAGMRFTRVSFKMDSEQMQKLVGNAPGQAEMMKAMLGKGDLSQWYGTDGKRLIQIGARSWDEARKMLDSFTNAGGGVGRTDGFKAATSGLPERANLVAVLNVQSYLRVIASVLGAAAHKDAENTAAADMPKEPAFLAISSTYHPAGGYEFHLVVPSEVGTVISRAIPLFQGIVPGANP